MLKIAAVLISLGDSYQRAVMSGMKQAAKDNEVNFICIQDKEPTSFKLNQKSGTSLSSMLNTDSLDALIFFTAILESKLQDRSEMFQYIESFPDVTKISVGKKLPSIPSITIDNQQGIAKILDHLIEKHQCRNIAFLTGPLKNGEARERFRAYKESLKKHSIPYSEDLVIYGSFSPNSGTMAVSEMRYQGLEKIDALVCSDDYNALEVIAELHNNGVSIPEDILVTGFDDISDSEYSIPSLTTLTQPFYNMGYQSILLALKQISSKKKVANLKLDLPLVIRESCGCKRPGHNFSINLLSGEVNEEILKKLEKEQPSREIAPLLEQWILFKRRGEDKPFKEQVFTLVKQFFHAKRNCSQLIDQLGYFFQSLPYPSISTKEWYFLQLQIIRSENLLKGKSRLEQTRLTRQMQESLQFRIKGASREGMKKKLQKSISILGVNKLSIWLYNEKSSKAELFFNYRNPFKIDKNFSPEPLKFPWEDQNSDDSLHYFFPIYSESESIGFLVSNIPEIPAHLFVDLHDKITRGIEGILLMEKIWQYTDHLEEEISKRTTEIEHANELLQEQSYNDPLSGLRNRRYLNEVVMPQTNKWISEWIYMNKHEKDRRKQDNYPFALLLFDIDHFKKVNDHYGHGAGDMLIQQFSSLLQDHCRGGDHVIRMGGEEFLLILENIQPDQVLSKATAIRRDMESRQFHLQDEVDIHVTCSVGCLSYPVDIEHPTFLSLEDSINAADHALYYGKEHDRNQAVTLQLQPEVFSDENKGHLFLSRLEYLEKEKKLSYISDKG